MTELGRIQSVSAVMRGVCTLGIVAIPVTLAAFWAFTSPEAIKDIRGLGNDVAALPPTFRLLAFLISMIPGAIAVYGLLALRRLFGAYRSGAIFAAGNAVELRTFALSVVGSVLANIVTAPALSVIVSWHNPPGTRELAITLRSDDLAALFVGCLFLVVAWIMAEAQRLAEDNAQIV